MIYKEVHGQRHILEKNPKPKFKVSPLHYSPASVLKISASAASKLIILTGPKLTH